MTRTSEADAPARVLFVTPRLDAQGGIASVVDTLMRSTLCERYECELLETVGSGRAVSRGLATLRSMIAALRTVHRLPTGSVVHLHMAQRGSFWRKRFIAGAAHRAGCRVVLHVHGSRFPLYASSGGRFRRKQVQHTLERSDRVVVLSDTWVEKMRDLAPNARIVVVENAVRIPDSPTLSADRPGVLFLGKLGEHKGVPTLLDAIGRLQSEGVRTHVTLAGHGDVEAARALVAGLRYPEDVSVPGWVDPARVAEDLLPAHGIFCLPSHNEGQPIALLEAMAHGMACVVTAVGGIPDTVVDGVDALIVPVDDAQALAEALGLLIADKAMRVRLGARARATAEQHYGIDVAVDALSALYEELGLRRRDGVLDA